jgi:UDP-N-acetylmuramoyl-tripeptide--D-alanyl-D-alanine ligase
MVCTDTRTIVRDCLFVGLKGEHFDGNLFAEEALNQGAKYVICEREDLSHNTSCIVVKNSLETLQNLALYHRKTLNIPFIGITGTNGKTTTKELVTKVLRTTYKTYSTVGNLNNHIGVPLTLLSIPKDAEMAVIEMGANHVGEIAELCRMVLPNYGIITNIGKAHLEGFGSIEGVIKTKRALYQAVNQNKGTIIINQDDPLLMNLGEGIPQIGYTKKYVKINTIEPFLSIQYEDKTVETHLTGVYNIYNICAAITVGKCFQIPFEKISDAIAHYMPKNNRSQIEKTAFNQVICDFYNANPDNMRAALENFVLLSHPKKYLILGDMLELGDFSESEHQNVIDFCKSKHLTHCFWVGENYAQLQPDAYRSVEELIEFFKQQPIRDALILVKGSRGIHLERLMPYL